MTLEEMRRMAESEIDPIENHGNPALGRIMLKLIDVAEAAKIVNADFYAPIKVAEALRQCDKAKLWKALVELEG